MNKLFLAALIALSCSFSYAADAQPAVPDQALEAKVQAISEVLRCLVCQNQNLADSHADLAIDLKDQVREMVGQGKAEKEVIDYMVARYGDFVLYRPPMKRSTWLLWLGPFVLLFCAVAALGFVVKRRRARDAAPLSDDDRLAAVRLLHG